MLPIVFFHVITGYGLALDLLRPHTFPRSPEIAAFPSSQVLFDSYR